MEWRIAIVDDLQPDREALAEQLHERLSGGADTLRLKRFVDAEGLLESFSPGAYQLAFLDVLMDGMNGVELAEQLRAADERLLIVFLTSSPEYIFDVQRFHPFDYLVKPCAPEALDRVLSEARRVLASPEPELVIRVERTVLRIPYGQIVAVSVKDRTSEIRTVSGQTLRAAVPFSEIERQLSADARFLPCYRGVLLNMAQIAMIGETTFLMLDGTEYPMRVRDRRELVKRFSQYQVASLRRRMD